MSVSDIDKLITGLEFYFEMNHTMFPEITEEEESDSKYCDQFCPLHFAVHEDDFEFEELMLRTPFDFSTLQFKLPKCDDGSTPMKRHRNCNARYIAGIITLITMLARMS